MEAQRTILFWGSESQDQFAASLVYSQRRFFRKDQTHTAEPKKLQLLGLTNAKMCCLDCKVLIAWVVIQYNDYLMPVIIYKFTFFYKRMLQYLIIFTDVLFTGILL